MRELEIGIACLDQQGDHGIGGQFQVGSRIQQFHLWREVRADGDRVQCGMQVGCPLFVPANDAVVPGVVLPVVTPK